MPTDADLLIFALANVERVAVAADRGPIVQRMLEASFNPNVLSADQWDLRPGAKIVGALHPSSGVVIRPEVRLSSLEAHTAKRIEDDSWPNGTSPAEYLADLRVAISSPEAELHVGYRDQTPKACLFCSVRGLPGLKLEQTDGDIFVVYNARSGHLITGIWLEAGERSRTLVKWRPCQKVP